MGIDVDYDPKNPKTWYSRGYLPGYVWEHETLSELYVRGRVTLRELRARTAVHLRLYTRTRRHRPVHLRPDHWREIAGILAPGEWPDLGDLKKSANGVRDLLWSRTRGGIRPSDRELILDGELIRSWLASPVGDYHWLTYPVVTHYTQQIDPHTHYVTPDLDRIAEICKTTSAEIKQCFDTLVSHYHLIPIDGSVRTYQIATSSLLDLGLHHTVPTDDDLAAIPPALDRDTDPT